MILPPLVFPAKDDKSWIVVSRLCRLFSIHHKQYHEHTFKGGDKICAFSSWIYTGVFPAYVKTYLGAFSAVIARVNPASYRKFSYFDVITVAISMDKLKPMDNTQTSPKNLFENALAEWREAQPST